MWAMHAFEQSQAGDLQPRPSMLVRIAREPFVHFAILGGLLFVLWGVARRGKGANATVGGTEVSRMVILRREDLASLRARFRASWMREPSPGELADLVQGFLCDEVLFHEGMARHLDRDDPIIRRRVIDKMAALARPTPQNRNPSREELRRWYASYPHRFVRAATVSFEQLYFGASGDSAAEATAEQALPALTEAKPTDPPPPDVGHKIVLPAKMQSKTDLELSQLMGGQFVRALADAPVGHWYGPVRSRHGVHLVRVLGRSPVGVPPFEEVEDRVRADWMAQDIRGAGAAAESLVSHYDIALPADVRPAIETAPGLAPFLARAR
jgi:peptidyl-prolyl cis-trans isomerase C